MIQVFDKKYKAISNLFVTTYDGNKYTFPHPISLEVLMENESKNQNNRFTIVCGNYYESILILDNYFSFFCYLLNYEFKIDTLIIPTLRKIEDSSDMSGYKGVYEFNNEETSMELGDWEVYDNYKKLHSLTHV